MRKPLVSLLIILLTLTAALSAQEMAVFNTYQGPEGYELYTFDKFEDGSFYFLSKNTNAILKLEDDFEVIAELPDSIENIAINEVFDIKYCNGSYYIPVLTSENNAQIVVYDSENETFTWLFNDSFSASYFAKKEIIASITFSNNKLICGILGSKIVKVFDMEDGSIVGWSKNTSAFGDQGLKNIVLIPDEDYNENTDFFTSAYSSGNSYKITKWSNGNFHSQDGVESYTTKPSTISSALSKLTFKRTVVMVEGAEITDAIEFEVTDSRIILFDNKNNSIISYSHELNKKEDESFSLVDVIAVSSPHYSCVKTSGYFYYILETTSNSLIKVGNSELQNYGVPAAEASVEPGTMVNLSAEVTVSAENSSDPFDKELTYEWNLLSNKEIDGLNFPLTEESFTFSSAEESEYTFELIVSNLFYCDKDTITITFGDYPDIIKAFEKTDVILKDDEPVTGLVFKPAVFLENGKTIWLAGDSYDTTHIYLSTDSGATFNKVTSVLASTSNIAAYSETEAFVSANDGNIYKTEDGGETWEVIFSYERSDGKAGYFNGLVIVNESVIIATGSGAADGEFPIFRSADAGQTWEEITAVDDYLSAKYAYSSYGKTIVSNGDNVWCTAYSGDQKKNYIFRSTDAGLTWTVHEPGAYKRIKSIDFANENLGILVDDNKTIMITKDGGLTWAESGSSPEGLNAFGVASIPGTQYLAVTGGRGSGYNGPTGCFYSKDMGESWLEIVCPDDESDPNAYGASFQSLDMAYLFSYRGPVFILESVEEETSKLCSNNISKNQLQVKNYPNPFNPETIIEFSIKETENVRIDIYNIMGAKVTTLTNELYQPGTHKIRWKAQSHATGIYFYQIKTKDQSIRKTMTLIK